MKKVTIEVSEEQCRVIQYSLDLMSRIGMGQFNVIVEHPTFEKSVHDMFAPNKELEVGDRTNRGEIVEIKDGLIKTKGVWDGKEEIKEWSDVENVRHSTNYADFHKLRDEVRDQLCVARNMLYGDFSLSKNGSWGIYHPKVDESCRVAYDILQVIRHEKWKVAEERSEHTVDSSVHLTTEDSERIKINIK